MKDWARFLSVVGFFMFVSFFVVPASASDRFVDHGDGTITDTKTGLMWAAADNGIPINWPDSLLFCEDYNGGGHNDWRLPTLEELASLYDPEYANERGYHVPRLIYTTASSCWASDTHGFKAARFNFRYGEIFWLRRTYSGPTRVLPVRSDN